MADSVVSDQQVDVITPDIQPKLMYAGDEPVGQPYIVVNEASIGIIGDPNHGIVVSPDFGIGLVGDISITETPDHISFAGGYWRINPQVLSCIPSTPATPVPFLIPGTPELLQAADGITSCMDTMEGIVGF